MNRPMLCSTGSEDLWERETSSCRRSPRWDSSAGLWEELHHVHLSSALAVCTDGPASFRQVRAVCLNKLLLAIFFSLSERIKIPNISVNEVRFPSNVCLPAKRLKISLIPDSWNVLKAAQLDENMRFWEILCSLELYSMCILYDWSRKGKSWARRLRQKLF